MSGQERRPRPVEGITGSDLGDEYLLYNQQGDKIHVLNATARRIYLLCDGNRTQEEIAGELAQRYKVDEETARSDTDAFVNELLELKVLTVS
jgi:hypothetical protein